MPSEASSSLRRQSAFMVALDVKDVEHLFAVGKAGRIHDDQVKFFAFVCGILQVLEHIGADDFVLFGVDAVEFEIGVLPTRDMCWTNRRFRWIPRRRLRHRRLKLPV